MRKLLLAIAAALTISCVQAQEITSRDVDSTYIYNALNNPNDYSQAPTNLPKQKVLNRSRISTNIQLGTSVSRIGTQEYVNPTISYQATDRLQLSVGMGIMFSSLNLRSFEKEVSAERQNIRALTNYYTASARYQVSSKCVMYGSVIYAQNSMEKGAVSPYWQKDRYMTTFGATFNLTESLSIGFEVRRAKNMGAYYGFENPYGCIGF